MTVDELNRRYGAPGRIVFCPGHCGSPNVVLANQYGTVELALMGANVLSYRPTGHSPVIFRPARRTYAVGEGFHGGVPVCWPQFGNRFSKDLPQHGFARMCEFAVRGTEYSEEKTEVLLGLASDGETMKRWPHAFDLTYRVTLSMKLTLELTTRNTGDAPFDFSCGFHPYFLVRERDDVTVRGLVGCTYVDGTKPGCPEGTFADDLRVDFAPDHIVSLPAAPKHEFVLLDPGLKRAVALVSSGNGRCVVWNCGEKGMSDYGPEDWRRYVCVEPVSDWPGGRTLAPGEKHVLLAAIQAHLETPGEK